MNHKHYKPGDKLVILVGGKEHPYHLRDFDIALADAAAKAQAQATREEVLAEIDAAAERCGIDGDKRCLYFFDGERYNREEGGPYPEVKLWGLELFKDAGVEHHYGDTFTAALLQAAKED